MSINVLDQHAPADDPRAAHVLSVVLVDDHPLVLEGLERALARDGMLVAGAFVDPHTAWAFLVGDRGGVSARVDLVVIDLRIGEHSGADLVRMLCVERPDVRVAVLTSHEDRSAAGVVVRAGARGFLLKDTPSDGLCANLRSVAEGNLVVDARVAAAVLDRPLALLSDTELAILRLVAEGLTNSAIGARLYLSHHTIKDYLSRIMRKLGTRTRAETVIRASQDGWLAIS